MPDTTLRATLGRIDHGLHQLVGAERENEKHLRSIASSLAALLGIVRTTDSEHHLPGPDRAIVLAHADDAALLRRWFPSHQQAFTTGIQHGTAILYNDHTGATIGIYRMTDAELTRIDADELAPDADVVQSEPDADEPADDAAAQADPRAAAPQTITPLTIAHAVSKARHA